MNHIKSVQCPKQGKPFFVDLTLLPNYHYVSIIITEGHLIQKSAPQISMLISRGGGGYSPILGDRMCRGNGVLFRGAFPRNGSPFNESSLDLGLHLG